MTERQMLVDQLVLHEGFRLKPYTDTVGKVTIGVGRNLTDKGLSSKEVFELLDHDLDDTVADLDTFPWFRTLDAVRMRAVVDLRFNLGPRGFRTFKQFLQALVAKDYAIAATELRLSRWAGQVQLARRERILAMIETGVDPHTKGTV